ncbi:RDD family protein [Kitasatospora aureofaciens]|uniref:RDD family protein n=1 Tax=Kitasatospora aureofaciens TaxID=1894 RepID=UPI001C458453|nr:RDD family protein [Kitasatospora aureofaciens]MBV6698411.1 RDD family protein [Kitasatospora aureofaciens]
MTDRPFAGGTDTAVGPTPGYYPDPSIPGFVRYWGGSAWVPGTSRPAPAEGEVLEPPRFVARRPGAGAGVGAGARFVPPPAPAPGPTDAADGGDGGGDGRANGSGETGPVYLDQTEGGASFVVGPQMEALGGPVFREAGEPVPPVSGVPEVSEAPELSEVAEGSDTSGWQVDPRAQRGLMETGVAPRWVSWGVLPGAPEVEEGRAEEQLTPVGEAAAAVGVASVTASGPVPAVAVRAATAVAVEVPERAEAAEPVEPVPAEPAAPVPAASAPAAPAVRPRRAAAARRRPAPAAPAELGRRLAARAVDTAVLAVVATAAAIPLGTSAADHIQQKLDQARMASALTRRQVQVWLIDDVVVGKIVVLLGILVFVSLLYEVLPTARTGQTFGKRLAKIRVADVAASPSAAARTRLSLGRALLRWVVGLLAVLLPIGLLWPLLDRPARRGWHDRAARTRVVRD